MSSDSVTYRLEEVFSSFYKIETIKKINYEQYIPKNQDERWSIQMELEIRKQDPQNLVALLSKELWRFSMNDEPIPPLPQLELNINSNSTDSSIGSVKDDPNGSDSSPIKPEKSGEFNADYSKPNLPPYYALFLKALKKSIYIKLALNSNSSLIQFGNACISLKDVDKSRNPFFQIEPHLFSNGDLAVSTCIKDLKFSLLKEDQINSVFFRNHAVYMAPSGIRAYVKISNKQTCLVPPPKNADILLNTLCFSHGFQFKDRKNVKWISVIPHLGHLNGQTPTVASYMALPPDSRNIVWPLDLCFAQSSHNDTPIKEDISSFENFQNALDMIDDFIQLRQTSAYRTPGSSGNMGTNPMSTGGAYTEQFQHFNKKSTSSINGNLSPLGGVQSNIKNLGLLDNSAHLGTNNLNSNNQGVSPLYASIDRAIPPSTDVFGPDYSTTPNPHENNNELFNDRKAELHISPIKSDIERSMLLMDDVLDDQDVDEKELFGEDDENNDEDMVDSDIRNDSEAQDSNGSAINNDVMTNKASDGDEDLFGETSGEDGKPLGSKMTSDEITEDMFGMSDDEDSNKISDKIIKSSNNLGFVDNSAAFETPRKQALKRKYLDVPIDEMTLSNSPLYVDPGAPLPVETPRDRRKSVFAPLTFNPIIENNVDNKYKNGGKFSFSPSQREEALKFDVSMAEISSSDDEDSDSSFEAFDYPNIKPDLRSLDGNVNDSHFLHGAQDSISTGLLSGNFNNNNDLYSSKDGSNSIWRLPQTEVSQTDSPLKSVEILIPSPLEDSNQTEHFGRMLNSETLKENESSVSRGCYDSIRSSENEILNSDNASSTSEMSTTGGQRSTTNIPFLLRHMPLSSIPDIFLSQNPTITIGNGNHDIIDLLCEQIVFDNSALHDLGIPNFKYEGTMVDSTGLIIDTMRMLFTEFNQMTGTELINRFYPIKEPFIFVRKHDELVKIRSDVQTFSKFLNFKPPFGIKNFKFLLLASSFKNDCLSFVSTLSQTYISQEFGFCELLKLSDEGANGLIFLKDFERTKLLLLAAQIVSYCSTNKHSGSDANLMIIIPLENNNLTELVAKTRMFKLIRDEVRSKIPKLDLFFKIVPMGIIRNPLTSVDSYYNLCASIYNLLPSKKTKFTTIAHKLPESITFRTMKSNHGSPIIHYDVYIHLAYSRSVDKKWVFAALSDSDGKENMIKSWYVGNSNSAFDDSCNEIWSMALSLASHQYGKICLILTRLSGILPDDELMNWRRLSGRNVHLAVVCVDDSTKISFFDQDRMYPSYRPIFRNESLSKPFNSKYIDDYEIRNINQDVHGVIFEYPFPLANSQHRCAIKSGALVRFKGNSGNSTWEKFEVNLLNCPHSDSTKLLETILEEFRNLAALNIWFGINNGEDTHIPWHVLAVKKMMNSIVHTQIDISEDEK